jgi:hypothetical protein
MDQKFAMLVLRDASCCIDRGALGVMDRSRAAVTGTPNGPTPDVRDNMLVLLGHKSYLPSRFWWVRRLATPLPIVFIDYQ